MPLDVLARILGPLRSGTVASRYPDEPPVLADVLRGLPALDPDRCEAATAREAAAACVAACPTGAITIVSGPGPGARADAAGARADAAGARADAHATMGAPAGGPARGATWTLDAGRCVFCGACARTCPTGAIRMTRVVELAAVERNALVSSVAITAKAAPR